MNQSPISLKAKSRRFFLAVGAEHYQLFTISQNRNDGSIYFSAPNFGEINWLVPSLADDRAPILLTYKANSPGKLSLHGSGIAHVSPYDAMGKNKFALSGSALKAHKGRSLGARHLLTAFLSEPRHRPASPAFARRTDCAIQSKEYHPYVMVFWAVPAVRNLNIIIKGSFHVDDLEEVPPNAGWGTFRLLLHSVIWFAYRTKYMTHWPPEAQACYHDGHSVPILIGTGEEEFRLDIRQATFKLLGAQLIIEM